MPRPAQRRAQKREIGCGPKIDGCIGSCRDRCFNLDSASDRSTKTTPRRAQPPDRPLQSSPATISRPASPENDTRFPLRLGDLGRDGQLARRPPWIQKPEDGSHGARKPAGAHISTARCWCAAASTLARVSRRKTRRQVSDHPRRPPDGLGREGIGQRGLHLGNLRPPSPARDTAPRRRSGSPGSGRSRDDVLCPDCM